MARGKHLVWGLVLAGSALSAMGCGGGSSGPVEIAFVSTRDGDYAIFGMAADGSGEHRLTDEESDPSTPEGLFFQIQPAWSPDGRLIAFASKREGASHVHVMNADGTGTRRVTTGTKEDSDPSWSPDGARIVFSRGTPGDIYIVDARGGAARRVATDAADERDPAWSPDGQWIVFGRRTPGTPIWELWRTHPDGTARGQLTRLRAVSTAPTWSPDGRRIAFSTNADGTHDIYVVGADGTGVRNVTTGPPEDFEPAWSPDGTTIAFSRDGAIVEQLPDGSERQLSAGENDSSPAWREVVAPS